MAAFSFHETKNVVSGEGGALTVNCSDLADRAEIIREKGTNRSQFFRGQIDKYTWVDVGSSYLPGELIASYLFAQLEVADSIRSRRLSLFNRYMEALTPLAAEAGVGVPVCPPDTTGNGHMFYLLMPSLGARTAFIQYMKQKGISSPFHYVPLHSSPGGRKFARSHGSMRETDRISETLVRLPMFFDLGSEVEAVIDAVSDYLVMRPADRTI
jgi:dTDP-4-amino-4,6-dideoxygalactose transaminase